MKIYENLIDEDEEILWLKEELPRDIIPNRRKYIKNCKKNAFGFILMVIIIIIISYSLSLLYIYFTEEIFFGFQFYLISSIFIFLCVGVILISLGEFFSRSDWEEKLTIYHEFLKYYDERVLRNYVCYEIITNKKILINSEYNVKWNLEKCLTQIEDVVELKRDFLLIYLNFLAKLNVHSLYGEKEMFFELKQEYMKLLRVRNADYTLDAMLFQDFSDQEFNEILKILFSQVPNLILES